MSRNNAVVVTGSSGGLGAATVKKFLTTGYRVYGLDRIAEQFSPDDDFSQFVLDVTSDEQIGDVFREVSEHSNIRGVVHCAGITDFGPSNPGHLISPQSGELIDNLASIENTVRTNLLGSFMVVRHAAAAIARRPSSEDNGRAFIVLTSSAAALDGKAGQSAYSASKSGVIGMTLPLARELSEFGIRVATIAPGLFDTPILEHTPRLTRHVPFPPRSGDPTEFASLAHHIAENSYINGEVIRLDGGIRGGFKSSTPFVR